ncbi:MAG: TatD family hydrolase [Paludibacter sp.]|nr:TatD family hydrolase [Paludibacter sp.]
MFFDIHTHNPSQLGFKAIRSLSIEEAEKIFSTSALGLFSVGFHPWYASKFSIESFGNLEKWTSDNRFIAIGECGLDKNSDTPIEQQLEIFKMQITLSEKIEKPLIIHCVGCFNELLDLKKTLNPSQLWIIHGFRGKPGLATQALKAGCALSFGEYFNSESVRVTPIERLYVETDESELPIEQIYRTIAEVRGCNPNDLYAGEKFYNRFLSNN